MSPAHVVCVDTGSTFTKAAAVVVDGPVGALLASVSVPTTVGQGRDVLEGVDAALDLLAARLGADPVDVRACSSAGGGLRLAVAGYERVVTAEAGARVALSAGAKVVHVASGRLDRVAMQQLRTAAPDVVLLVGGTDGGDADVLRHNGAALAARGPRVPYVVAGNAAVREEVVDLFSAAGRTASGCENVLPRIGVLAPDSARATIREVFVRHVIGGKGLSRGPRFARLVRGATPDLVLTGVEVLASELGGDVLVVDIGGATTDVYSVLTPDPEEVTLRREVVETVWHGRTVEGDLGMRWGAPGVVAAAAAERLLPPGSGELRTLDAAAERRHDDVGFLPATEEEKRVDLELARLAATVAVRRHARATPTSAGRDLSRVRALVLSGGVVRYADPGAATAVAGALLTDHGGGWRTPTDASLGVDRDYVLAAVGLLAPDHPDAAAALARSAAQVRAGSSPPARRPGRRASRSPG